MLYSFLTEILPALVIILGSAYQHEVKFVCSGDNRTQSMGIIEHIPGNENLDNCRVSRKIHVFFC